MRGEARARILAIEFACFFSFPHFFFFFFLLLSAFFFPRSNAHTHKHKGSAKRRGKAERGQRQVRFTRFVDYRLMFDSGRSFSF